MAQEIAALAVHDEVFEVSVLATEDRSAGAEHGIIWEWLGDTRGDSYSELLGAS